MGMFTNPKLMLPFQIARITKTFRSSKRDCVDERRCRHKYCCAPRLIAAVSVAIFLKEIAAKGLRTKADHPPANYVRLISSNTDCSPLQCPPAGLVLLRCISRANSALEF